MNIGLSTRLCPRPDGLKALRDQTYLLIRHAQSANNALPENQRVCDPGLTETGLRQAELLGTSLINLPIASLYCSGFLRSMETAAAISRAVQLPAYVHSKLYEVKGCYSGFLEGELMAEPGMGRADILRRYSNWEIDPLIEDGGWNFNQQVETEEQADLRAEYVANWLVTLQQSIDGEVGSTTALVIHADFKVKLLIALARLAGLPPETSTAPWSIRCPRNTSITRVVVTEEGLRIEDYDNVNHLPDDLITE